MVESETQKVLPTEAPDEQEDAPATPGQPPAANAEQDPEDLEQDLEEESDGNEAILEALAEQNKLLRAQIGQQARQLEQQNKTLENLTATVASLAATAHPATPQTAAALEDAELAEQLRAIKKEIANQALATLRGENPHGRARVKEYLAEFREFATEMGGMKAELDAAATALGGGKAAAPEPDMAEQAEKALSALERASQTRVGAKILAKLGLGDASETPALEHEPETDVKATYG